MIRPQERNNRRLKRDPRNVFLLIEKVSGMNDHLQPLVCYSYTESLTEDLESSTLFTLLSTASHDPKVTRATSRLSRGDRIRTQPYHTLPSRFPTKDMGATYAYTDFGMHIC